MPAVSLPPHFKSPPSPCNLSDGLPIFSSPFQLFVFSFQIFPPAPLQLDGRGNAKPPLSEPRFSHLGRA